MSGGGHRGGKHWSVGLCPTPWCRKRAYETRRAAKGVRDAMRQKGGGVGEGLTVYRCAGSGYFHLGHRDPRFVHRGDDGQP